MANVVVLGSGGWGTALAVTADRHGHTVTLWSPFEEEIASIRRHGQHRKLLPDIPVSPTITLTTDIAAAADADLVILAVPSFAIASTAERLRPVLKAGTVVANAGKGLEEGTYRRFTEVIEAALPGISAVALSGPSHAEEVGRGIPTLLVSASRDAAAARKVQEILMNPVLRIYTGEDVIGVELGGALKILDPSAGVERVLRLAGTEKIIPIVRSAKENK